MLPPWDGGKQWRGFNAVSTSLMAWWDWLVPLLEPVRSGPAQGTWAGMSLGALAGAVSQGSMACAPCEGVCVLHLQGVSSSAWRKGLPSGTSS